MPLLLDKPDDGCSYPVTDDTPFIFCGRQRRDGSSYCARHHAVCYLPPDADGRGDDLASYFNHRDGILRCDPVEERVQEL